MAKNAAKNAAPAKKSTRDSFIAKAPIRRLMKREGAILVSESAVVMLIEVLTKLAATATKEAMKIVKADKRKRVTAPDIISATI